MTLKTFTQPAYIVGICVFLFSFLLVEIVLTLWSKKDTWFIFFWTGLIHNCIKNASSKLKHIQTPYLLQTEALFGSNRGSDWWRFFFAIVSLHFLDQWGLCLTNTNICLDRPNRASEYVCLSLYLVRSQPCLWIFFIYVFDILCAQTLRGWEILSENNLFYIYLNLPPSEKKRVWLPLQIYHD